MASSINLGVTPVLIGQQQFTIDGLPNNSVGFELIVGLNLTWTAAIGSLFDLLLEFSADGAVFREWIRVHVDGGPVKGKDGQSRSTWTLSGAWPGEHDGSADPKGRRTLRAASLRITLTVAQVFTAQSVVFRTV